VRQVEELARGRVECLALTDLGCEPMQQRALDLG